jgi:hypothetical protein
MPVTPCAGCGGQHIDPRAVSSWQRVFEVQREQIRAADDLAAMWERKYIAEVNAKPRRSARFWFWWALVGWAAFVGALAAAYRP